MAKRFLHRQIGDSVLFATKADESFRLHSPLYTKPPYLAQRLPRNADTLNTPHPSPAITTTTPPMESYTHLPIRLDPSTKALSAPPTASTALRDELAALNALHRTLITSETAANGVPPAPLPVNPKRSTQVGKLREAGNAAYKKGQHADALRMYSLGLEMALGRPGWEPAGLVREEASALYANRAQAHMAVQEWADGAVDAECSVELKRVGNAKAWWRRGRCLLEMGRLQEARAWVESALEFEAGEADLVALLREIEAVGEKRGR